jgi:hypothetical protein
MRYQFFWNEQPWAWVTAFHEAGMPYAHFLAPFVAMLIVGVAVSWIIGFLTRLFAFLIFLPRGHHHACGAAQRRLTPGRGRLALPHHHRDIAALRLRRGFGRSTCSGSARADGKTRF